MSGDSLLAGKRILAVDDEQDVLETLEQLLPMCDIVKASSFDLAKNSLETQQFDFAILDIMGVNGFELLAIANKRLVPAVMLTAHGMSVANTIKSFKEGAAFYVPKEELSKLSLFLTDIIEAKEKGKSSWWRWLERFKSHYENQFGSDWQKPDKDFWDKFPYYY